MGVTGAKNVLKVRTKRFFAYTIRKNSTNKVRNQPLGADFGNKICHWCAFWEPSLCFIGHNTFAKSTSLPKLRTFLSAGSSLDLGSVPEVRTKRQLPKAKSIPSTQKQESIPKATPRQGADFRKTLPLAIRASMITHNSHKKCHT